MLLQKKEARKIQDDDAWLLGGGKKGKGKGKGKKGTSEGHGTMPLLSQPAACSCKQQLQRWQLLAVCPSS